MTDTSAGLAAIGIEKSFGALNVLSNVSIAVKSGEVVGLLGPNGAGKSTLVNVIAGYESTDKGEVTLDGRTLTALSPSKRAHLGLARTFQSARLFPRLTVAENAALGALGVGTTAAEADKRTGAALSMLGLTGVAESPAAGLSHGLTRLTGLARAITARPQYLMMDEPAAGLNEQEIPTLLEALERIRAEHGCGMLLIEHNVALVADACSRVAVLAAGNVIFDGGVHAALEDAAVKSAYLGDAAVGIAEANE